MQKILQLPTIWICEFKIPETPYTEAVKYLSEAKYIPVYLGKPRRLVT